MKKNYLLGMFAAASMLLATSCSSDELESAQSGNEAQVTFSLGLEGGIGSRTISDGTKADKLVYAVYKIDPETGKPELQNVLGSDGNGQFVDEEFTSGKNVKVTLAKGQTYQVAFWAQDGDCKAYDTDDLTNVTVDYKNAANNDEVRDAFFKTVEFTVAGNRTIDVVLKRPFAQINVGVYKTDWEAAVASGIEIEKSEVIIKNAATSINLLTGAVGPESTDVAVTYSSTAIPSEDLNIDHNKDKVFADNEKYKWLSMSYILVADHDEAEDTTGLLGTDRATLVGLEYTFTPKRGNAIEFSEGLNGAPVQRNWRTNILGKILTGDIDFHITIDPVYDGDIIYPNASELEQQLEMVATFGGTIVLSDNVTLSKSLNVTADMVLDLNGHTITGPAQATDANGKIHAIENNGNLTIKNGTVTSQAKNGGSALMNKGTAVVESATLNGAPNDGDGWPSYAVNNLGTLTLNNSTVTSYHGAVCSYAADAVVTMNNTNIDMSGISGFTSHGIYTYDNGKVIVNGGNIANNATDQNTTGGSVINGNVEVTAGNFTGRIENYSGTPVLKGGTYSVDPSNYVAEGYSALKFGNTYQVLAVDAANRTITINSVEEFLNLNNLNNNWAVLFSNGQGTEYSNYATQNGGKGTDFYYRWTWTIKLNADLDLGNITLDAPINLTNWGIFDGQNYTIKNVKITTLDSEKTAAGLFNSNSYCAIKNLKLDNVHVEGSFVGNSTAGILAADCNSGIDNITITNSSVIGGKYTGGVVGYGYTDVTNCTLTDCVVKGGYKFGGVIGYICASNGQIRKVEGNTLTACTVQDAGQYAGGKTEYVMGMIVGNYNCDGTCSNNTVEDMTTEATGIIGMTEAGKNVEIKGQTFHVPNSAALQSALDNATEGTTIYLAPNVSYDLVYMGRPTKYNATTMACEDHSVTTTNAETFKGHQGNGAWHPTPKYTTTLKNLTVVGAAGAKIAGLVASSGHKHGDNVHDYVLDVDKSGSGYYNTLYLNNIKFSNVAFTGKIDINTSDATSTYDGITFEGCTFTTGGTASDNGPAIRYYNEANNGNVKNINVMDCNFTNVYQGVYVHHVNGVKITSNTFDTTGHNAIAMQGHDGAVDLKTVVIMNNTFKNIGDRIIRFNNVGAESNITIKNNTATNSGDDAGEVIKATSIEAGIITDIDDNDWGDGTVVNKELRDKTFEVADGTELNTALGYAPAGSTIILSEDTNYGTVTVGELQDVTIEGAENAAMRFVTDANSKIKNVTLKNVDFKFAEGTGQTGGAFVVINKDAEINNLVIEGCTIVGDGKKSSYGIYGQNPNASIVVKNCSFSNLGYAIQTTAKGGYKSLIVENCKFEGLISWAIMPQYDPYSGDLTVTGCNFINCLGGGLIKAGNLTANHTFTFTDNTITNCSGHDGSDSKWFTFNVSAGTSVISGNTKDGAAWTPGTAEGLTKQ